MALKWTKQRAGLYSAVLDGGRAVDVEYLTTAYGDSGWVWWLENGRQMERADAPYPTKKEAVAALERVLAAGY